MGALGTSQGLVITGTCACPSGGIKQIWIADAADIASYTQNGTTLALTAVVLATLIDTNKFKRFDLQEETGEFKEDYKYNAETGCGYYEISLMWRYPLRDQASRNVINTLKTACSLTAIVQDANDVCWVLNDDPSNSGAANLAKYIKRLRLTGDTEGSGKKVDDFAGSELTLTMTSKNKSNTLTLSPATINSTLVG